MAAEGSIVREDKYALTELTLAYIKPDAFKNDSEIFGLIARTTDLVALNPYTTNLSEYKARSLYREHEGKPFYEELISHTTSGPVCVFLLAGPHAVSVWRETLEKIRSKYALDGPAGTFTPDGDPRKPGPRNAVHGSDSLEAAQNEISLLYPEYRKNPWFYRRGVLKAFGKQFQARIDNDAEKGLCPSGPLTEEELIVSFCASIGWNENRKEVREPWESKLMRILRHNRETSEGEALEIIGTLQALCAHPSLYWETGDR
jgi:nucleoside diphosphate kinase